MIRDSFPSRGIPAYARQVCLDLLNAKQEALDKGVEFRNEIICDRCASVFASLDLTHDVCRELNRGELPDALRNRLNERLRS